MTHKPLPHRSVNPHPAGERGDGARVLAPHAKARAPSTFTPAGVAMASVLAGLRK